LGFFSSDLFTEELNKDFVIESERIVESEFSKLTTYMMKEN
jgi:hypothetical protein